MSDETLNSMFPQSIPPPPLASHSSFPKSLPQRSLHFLSPPRYPINLHLQGIPLIFITASTCLPCTLTNILPKALIPSVFTRAPLRRLLTISNLFAAHELLCACVWPVLTTAAWRTFLDDVLAGFQAGDRIRGWGLRVWVAAAQIDGGRASPAMCVDVSEEGAVAVAAPFPEGAEGGGRAGWCEGVRAEFEELREDS